MARGRISLPSVWEIAQFLFDHKSWIASFVGGLIMTHFVAVTTALKPYAPASYAIAFLLGTIGIFVLVRLAAGAAAIWARRSFWNYVQQLPDRDFNPLETTFNRQRIPLDQMCDPLTRVISGKTFVDCELLGKRLTFMITGCRFIPPTTINSCDLISLPMRQGQVIPPAENYFIFVNCTFQQCKFYWGTLLFGEQNAQEMIRSGYAGRWLVPPPP